MSRAPSPRPASRRTRRAAAAAGLAALALSGPAGAAIPTADGTHLWAFDGRPANPKDAAYATRVARIADIVVGRDGWKPYIASMHRTKPGIVVTPYRSGMGVGGADLEWMKQNHPDWLLKDTAGRHIVNEWGLTLMNPASAGVRGWQADRARRDQAAGWDATYLDALGLYGLLSSSARPVDPSTGKPFTLDSWMNATSGLAAAVDRAITIPLIANGLRDGRTFYGYTDAGRFVGTRTLVPNAQGHVFEGCFRAAKAPISAWPPVADWKMQVDAIAAVQAAGKLSLCMTKTWSATATDTQRQQWHDFGLASTLLVNAGRSYFHFTGRQGEPADTRWPNTRRGIGTPAGARTTQGNLHVRRFTTGMVVVNPSGTAQTIALGGSYKTLSGATVTSLRAAPHTGHLLVKA